MRNLSQYSYKFSNDVCLEVYDSGVELFHRETGNLIFIKRHDLKKLIKELNFLDAVLNEREEKFRFNKKNTEEAHFMSVEDEIRLDCLSKL